jgi:hypothetical protein
MMRSSLMPYRPRQRSRCARARQPSNKALCADCILTFVTFSRARAMNDEGFTFRKLCQQLGISHQVIPSPFASQ